MHRLLERALHNPPRKPSARSPEKSLQDYLDSLCDPLTGVLPAEHCREVRMEAEGHLLALIAELRTDGLLAGAATDTALRAYGAPRSLGRAIRRTWNAGAGARALRSRTVARLAAFFCVSLLMFDSGALLEMYIVDPGGSGTPLGLLLIELAALAVLTGGVTALDALETVRRTKGNDHAAISQNFRSGEAFCVYPDRDSDRNRHHRYFSRFDLPGVQSGERGYP